MKRLFTALLGLMLAAPAFAGMDLPTDQGGIPVADAQLAGGDTCVIEASSATRPVLCVTGKGVVLAVLASSLAATTDFLTFRDSATANTTSTKLGVFGFGAQNGSTSNVVFFRFTNGLSVDSSAVQGGAGVWTVIYRKR